jgi:hypothetical protein
MRGLGTPASGIYPGYIRRVNSGTFQVAGAASQSLATWDLRTTDLAATVETAGYFNSMAAQLAVGDVIMAVMAIGGTMKLKLYMVTVNTGSAVTVALANLTAG